jgi:hypothetical protein
MTRQLLAIGLAAASLCGAARADLIVNGSFEDHVARTRRDGAAGMGSLQ